jgi:hypothetical protein
MQPRRRALLWGAGVVVLVAALLLTPLPPRWHSQWQAKLFDLGHVHLFAGMTLLLWLLLPRPWYAPALIALSAAALGEIAQNYVGRDGNFPDFLRGALGVLAAQVVIHALQGRRSLRRLSCHAVLIIALLAWPVWDAVPWLLDAVDGFQSFPTLADFRSAREVRRWLCEQATLERTSDSAQPGVWLGRLELLPGPQPYPRAALQPIVRDWTLYRRLCCAFSLENDHLALVFSIRSSPDSRGQTTHYQQGKFYDAGKHVFEVDLATVAREAEEGPLDLSSVQAFQVFTVRPPRPGVVYLEHIWLE